MADIWYAIFFGAMIALGFHAGMFTYRVTKSLWIRWGGPSRPSADRRTSEPKLFIWHLPSSPERSGAMLYVVGRSLEEAREISMKVAAHFFACTLEHEQPDLGPPEQIHSLPYAGLYQWHQ